MPGVEDKMRVKHTVCRTGSLAMLETESLTFSSTRARYPGSSNSGSSVTLLARLDSLNWTISGLGASVSKPVAEEQHRR